MPHLYWLSQHPLTKVTPNKLSAEIKESLSLLISEAVSSLDINAMSKSEKLKLIQLGLP